MNRFLALLLLLINGACIGQSKHNKPIDVSIFYSIGCSFSRLENKSDSRYTSPPALNALNYGLKVERQIKVSDSSLYMNSGIGSGNLSVGSYYRIRANRRTDGHGVIVVPNYTVWSFGVKKRTSKKNTRFRFNVEAGIKLFFLHPSERNGHYSVSNVLDTPVITSFVYSSSRKTSTIPYMGFGVDFVYKNFKAGLLLWGQYGFTPIHQYEYEVKYGSKHFKSDVISYGASLGANFYVKLLTF